MPNETFEYDHYPEIVDDGRGHRRVELLGLAEELVNRGQGREFFAGLDDERFRKFAGYVNAVTQHKPISYEYGNGRLAGIPTPPTEDKAVLMKETFEAVREILNTQELDDADALRRAGLTMAGALN